MISQGWPHQKQYIDAKDRQGNWQVALVLSKSENQIKIRFDGWSNRYDETLLISPQPSKQTRIQPFRSHTRGYTGIKKNITPRQHWKYTNEDIQIRLKKVQDFVLNRREKKSEELIQFLRGQHYLYIDFLLSTSYPHQQDLTHVYQYFKLHIQFINIYIQDILRTGLTNWLRPLAHNHQFELEEDAWHRHYANCAFQISEALYNIAGLNERLSNFQKYNEKAIKQIANLFETHENYISSQLIATGAFDTIKRLIIQTNKCQTEIPVLFVYSLYQLFLSIQKTLLLEKDLQLNTLLEFLSSITVKSFQSLSSQYLKTNVVDKQIEEILAQVKFILGKHHRKQLIKDWLDQFRLKYYVLIINSNTIERKFKGLFKLREYCFQFIDHSILEKRQTLGKSNPASGRLKKIKLQQLLFQKNEHAQFFKKCLDLVAILYRGNLVSIEVPIYAWNHSIHKQAEQVKNLYKFSLQIAANLFTQDIPVFLNFIHIVIKYYNDSLQNGNNQAIQFYFQFVQTIMKTYRSHKKTIDDDPPPHFEQLQKLVKILIQSLYQNLFSHKNKDNLQLLTLSYSHTILLSSRHIFLIMQLFNNLTHQLDHQLSIYILFQVYQLMEKSNLFIPSNYSTIILNCLKTINPDFQQTRNLIKLFNRILLTINQTNSELKLKPSQFKQFWDLFQAMPQAKRNIFYQWVTDSNKQVADGSSINPVLHYQLKRQILIQFLKEENFANFQNLTRRQLQIIIEFYLDVNQSSLKIETKTYSPDYKIFRLRSIQTIKQNLLWSVFEKCKNTDVINILNKQLIHLHFYYAPSVPYNLRKGRVDEFITKIKDYLHQGYTNKNTELIKHALMLLKNMIEIIKEERHETDPHQAFIKIQFFFENKSYTLEVKYEDTIQNIKHKVAIYLKLKPSSIKMLNAKNQQLSYDAKEIPIYCFPQKYFKVIEIPKEEQTMTKFVYSLLSLSMQQILYKMLQIQETAQEVYELLDQLQIKQDRHLVLQRVNDIILKQHIQDESTCKFIHYYYLLQIKLYTEHSDDQPFIQQALATPSFTRLIATLNYPIKLDIHIHLILKMTHLLIKIFKKGIKFEYRSEVAQKCLDLVHEIYLFAERKRVHMVNADLLNKIVHNANFLMEEVVTQNGMLLFIISKKRFEEMLGLLYFSSNLQQVKTIMMEKVKRYLGMYKIQPIKNILMEEKIFQLYCHLFYKQLVHFFQNRELKYSKGKMQLFHTISKVLQAISPSVFELNVNPPHSFYDQVMAFIHSILQYKHLRYFQTSHLMVSGHLHLLKSIIQKRPQLKSIETVSFILNKCLNNQDITLPSICRHASAVKACFQIVKEILHSNNKPQFFKCIMKGFQGSQKITFWRIQNKWSIKANLQTPKIYRGLVNPGCICYMNSLLQQLFMIDQFRAGVLGLNTHWLQDNENEEGNNNSQAQILQSMKELFLKLMYSDQSIINPILFAKTIKNPQKKQLIKINQQMDIDQFETILFEKVEKQLQLLGSRNMIRQLFGGVYSNQIISLQCTHRSEREESFISISLEVKKNIYQCFRSFVKVDCLDGDNKYFCELCNKKVKAQKIQSIKKLPPFLIVCLKRFEFNFQIEAKTKINNYCQFYPKINLKQFSTQEISRKWINDQQNETQQVYADGQFNYKLRGVVIHTGSADSGHYYSLIEDKAGNWFEFNDDEVFPFDISKLEEQAFGNKNMHDDHRVRNAYLLIYERQSISNMAEQTIAQPIPRQIPNKEEIFNEDELQQNKKMISIIRKKNHQMEKYSLVFSESYQEFIEFLVSKYEELTFNCNQASVQQQWYDFYLAYYFLILIRKDSFDQFITFSKYLQQSIKKNRIIRYKYLKLFNSCSFIDQFFVSNPNKQRCKVISHLFSTAFIDYIKDTLEVTLELNEQFNHILLTIKIMLICYGQLYELSIGLRRVFQFLATNYPSHLHYIIKRFSFQNIYLDLLFGNVIHPKQKQQFSQILIQNKKKTVISFIPPLNSTDRKLHTTQSIQNWIILSILLRQANKMVASSPEECDSVRANLGFLTSVVSSATPLKIIYESANERGANYLYKVYKELKLGYRLCEGLQKGLKDYQSVKYRPFMLVILAVIKDTSRQISLNTIIDILQNVHKHNEKYFLEVDLITQWIVRFLACSEQFLKQFQTRSGFLQSIAVWLEKGQGPTVQHLKKHKLPHNDKFFNRYFGLLVSSDPNQYKDNIYALKKVYQSVIDDNFKLKGMVGRTEQPLTPGKQIKYFDTSNWKWIESGCTVLSNNFGYLQVKVGKQKIYLWQDSEKVKASSKQLQLGAQRDDNSEYSSEQSDQSEEEQQL